MLSVANDSNGPQAGIQFHTDVACVAEGRPASWNTEVLVTRQLTAVSLAYRRFAAASCRIP
jgi:hypothetical protein